MYRLYIVIFILINVTVGRESIHMYKTGDCRDVNTIEGVIRGHVVVEGNYEYIAFLGVPYAAPPIGNMRFKVSRLEFHVRLTQATNNSLFYNCLICFINRLPTCL